MPQSRNRPGHQYQKPADVPASQRVKGRIVWAILIGIFAGLIALFSAGQNWLVVFIAVAVGAVIGFVVGKNMEQDAKK